MKYWNDEEKNAIAHGKKRAYITWGELKQAAKEWNVADDAPITFGTTQADGEKYYLLTNNNFDEGIAFGDGSSIDFYLGGDETCAKEVPPYRSSIDYMWM